MAGFGRFWEGFTEAFDRLPVWLPGTAMQVGDIGVVDRRGYIKMSSLTNLGIQYETEPVTDAAPDYFVSSANSRSADGHVALQGGALPGLGEAGAEMAAEFSSEGSFIVRAQGVAGERLSDVLGVESDIQQLNAQLGAWKRGWIYVQEVVSAEPLILLVSGKQGGKAKVTASGSGLFSELFSAGARLSLAEEVSLLRYVVSNNRVPLMWRGRCQRGILGPHFRDRGDGSSGEIDTKDSLRFEDFEDVSAVAEGLEEG